MVLELHIWGPAFGLPSIDPECTATVAYLKHCLPEEQWILIADHDPSVSPNREFPALLHNSTWIAGFHTITRYLRQQLYRDIDARLSSQQRADSIAFSTLLSHSALPLLSLSLYTSFQNYYHITRPAFTSILPWHANYSVPPARREVAKAVTQHFGFSGLDIDDVHESTLAGGNTSISGSYESAKAVAGIPTGNGTNSRPNVLPLGFNKSIKKILNKPEYAARFRLDALTKECLQPLDDLLGEKSYLLTDGAKGPSSLDCLAFGYLSLMLYPDFPQAWLREGFDKYPRLQDYVHRMRDELVGGNTVVADVMALQHSTSPESHNLNLPWHPRVPEHPIGVAQNVATSILSALPLTSHFARPSIIPGIDVPETSTDAMRANTPSSPLLTPFLALSTILLAFVSSISYLSLNRDPRSEDDYVFFSNTEAARRNRAQSFGEAGGFMAALGNQMRVNSGLVGDQGREQERVGGAPVVEVDVEVREKPGL
ncbi:hypothetical protein M501DRAFT_1033250 [Patellaria atrata CBS 101060]|uniref:Mitochondrial outer membrane transport complex Sam37/metaxin N-terminal domain-containing protein n=1 Tax=Patellaria atrata CBS 101060 TaxID=1346257 RepID=A0A9P4S8L8_9PEZI|nr:hypothetical protein M501DRAFT_1033250 [Patellaria atrata CBS 101060]